MVRGVFRAVSRFLSSFVMNVDKKGRVSIPAPFRAALSGTAELYALKALEQPSIDAGPQSWLDELEKPLDQLDPLSQEFEHLSLLIHGDGAFVKLDDTGRMVLPDFVRDHAGITDQVAFVGRRHFFSMWEPSRFSTYREEVRQSVLEKRKAGRG